MAIMRQYATLLIMDCQNTLTQGHSHYRYHFESISAANPLSNSEYRAQYSNEYYHVISFESYQYWLLAVYIYLDDIMKIL